MDKTQEQTGEIHIGTVGQFINKVESGATVNYYEGQSNVKGDYSDLEIARAIRELLDTEIEPGKKLMTDQAQWFAVKCVLVTYRNYPKSTPQFCQKIKTIGIVDSSPECKPESINQAGKTMTRLATSKPADWTLYKSIGVPYEKQWNVANALMEKLDIL